MDLNENFECILVELYKILNVIEPRNVVICSIEVDLCQEDRVSCPTLAAP